ncbi:MAG TPA: histidine kinase dimerization/phospho-acceptor domain-containing protein [Geminicoccaceae bacterium]|nr:histidine kinase dimerization/phospho-acceptor domain-containing protein [Geminicoccaceae bacterium]
MLETLDPANRLPAAPDDPAGGAAAVAPPPAGACADLAPANGDRRGPHAGACEAAAPPWASDWLQLSHELRTPLNAILGNIELLLDGSAGPLAAPARACVGDIQAASRQLLSQLQPLLLLVQVRTAAAVAGPPIDLLALLRQAASAPPGEPAPVARGELLLPRGVSLMLAGDPVWLGALAAAMVELHAGSPQAREPLSITLERLPRPAEEQAGCCTGGVLLRACWPGLDAAATAPLRLALIDALLTLHGGRIRCLSPQGLCLELPSARVLRSGTAERDGR